MRRTLVLVVFTTIAAIASVALAADLPKGLWRSLARPGAKWTLPVTDKGADSPAEPYVVPDKLVVQVRDVRKVGIADVVRLVWSAFKDGKPVEAENLSEFPRQVVITDKGVYFFAEDAKDARITAALKKKPEFADPPKPVKRRGDGGRFAFAPAGRKDTLCLYLGRPMDDGECCGDAPCYQTMCVDVTGIVGAGGLGNGDSYGYGFQPDIPGHGCR